MKKYTTSNWNRVINFRFAFLWIWFIKFFEIMKMPENCHNYGHNHIFFKLSVFVLMIFWTFDIITIPKHNYVEWIHIRNISGWVYVIVYVIEYSTNTAHFLHCSVNSKGGLNLKSSFHDCKQNPNFENKTIAKLSCGRLDSTRNKRETRGYAELNPNYGPPPLPSNTQTLLSCTITSQLVLIKNIPKIVKKPNKRWNVSSDMYICC